MHTFPIFPIGCRLANLSEDHFLQPLSSNNRSRRPVISVHRIHPLSPVARSIQSLKKSSRVIRHTKWKNLLNRRVSRFYLEFIQAMIVSSNFFSLVHKYNKICAESMKKIVADAIRASVISHLVVSSSNNSLQKSIQINYKYGLQYETRNLCVEISSGKI